MTPALSPSRAADFKQCPLLFRFRTIDKLEGPPSPAAARGTLVHSVLEHLFEAPAAERTPEAALALLPGRWAALVEERPELADLIADGDAGEGVSEASWLKDAEALVRRWFELEDPTRLEPAERELWVEPDGAMRVVDYKTGRSPGERFEGKALFQMKFYALVLWRTRGEIPKMLQLVYLGDGQVVRYVPEEHELRSLERNLQAVWAAVARAAETGDWRPSPSKLCGWCDFQEFCPEFGGNPPPLPDNASSIVLDPQVSGQVEAGED
jgi:putative RecB family exonuclease